MKPPGGFHNQLNPLRHRLEYSAGLSVRTATMNSVMFTLVRSTNDVIAGTPGSIVVSPFNPNLDRDSGPAVCKNSILDRINISLKFNLTENFDVDKMTKLQFLWRPIFFSFTDKLDAADEVSTTTVKGLLGLSADTTNEDVVPLTTNKLPVIGGAMKDQPLSTVNIAEAYNTEYNMTTDATMEDVAWQEDIFQKALRSYTNKGALKACIGRTRHVTLSRNQTYKNFYLSKFVPRSIRRVMPYTFLAILVHVPIYTDIEQEYNATGMTASIAHLGIKCLTNYHEWNIDHFQEREGTAPT